VIWSVVELNTGIVCESLRALRTLVSRYYPTLFPLCSAWSGGNVKYADSWSHQHRNSLKRASRGSNGFGTLADDDTDGHMKLVDADIERKRTKSGSRSDGPEFAQHIPPYNGSQDKAVVVVDISSGTAGLTALPTPRTFANSTRMPGADRTATPPVDEIRVMTSVRQTVEKEHGRTRTYGRIW
jgi:hypothetical protein